MTLTFSLKQMTLRKGTVDISVKFNPQSEQTKGRDTILKTLNNNSFSRKQDKNISQNTKKSLKI